MDSLEFIEKEIKYEKENIKLWTPKKETNERLNHLHQIKNILEAWEVVSNPLNIIHFGDGILEIWCDDQEEIKIKKALEVKENE